MVGISDIQKLPDGNIEIVFCEYPSCKDFLTINIDQRTTWEIANYCRENLSLKAQEKKNQ